MSGPDTAQRTDQDHARALARVDSLHAMSPWWRVIDAETFCPPINAEGAVWTLYDKKGANR